MKHETLQKLYAEVESRRSNPKLYDIWLSDDTANQLMGEADKVELKEGTLVLTFDEGYVVLKVGGGCVITEYAEFNVKVLGITSIYRFVNEDTSKKSCICL